ncbi:glutamate-5-semialdehyde dehydrogenase [Ruminococcus flavefaciens]|jgi:glutamate-5-semialdehyde dehydrogenase|uniref:Gamma-glutamyl phosphate reductase n=1 Tax=Ruminococcus flavefaciens TaxID=1265 RepID=A0A315XYA8_RUMFL|nr:glutamate-5-semialdehyde dehydrogenase [Ruminococcus flavefaciens]PWJ11531.1 glutamate-5-semialdehyde dehydrogenase [Ruminococcus flavefaciens]SSA50440.1 glutamate-5-semialdehyde dehydrogenase [Ruminococcus flavefaciens]
MSYTEELGKRAKAAEAAAAGASTQMKDSALAAISKALIENKQLIIEANAKDIAAAKANGMTEAKQDRLKLDEKRIEGIAKGVDELIALKDPIGEVIGGGNRPNGLQIIKTRVPLGVIGIIFESRPNVTVDAAALCLKAGNVVILKGGKEAINSNICLGNIMRKAVEEAGLPADVIQVVDNTDRETTNELMRLNGYVDVIIPRGSANLIQAVVKNATVPVIETGAGNCHAYIDASADLDMAVNITDNAKTQRPSVCNAIESLLVHKDIADKFLPLIAERFKEHDVKIYGCDRTISILGSGIEKATETEYATEFNDFVIAVKVVDDIDEAIAHIRKYSTKHSECIVTSSLANARKFQKQVDAAAVYVNASTRFTDGGEFGFGAEIGISTQKLHARGPMGLTELTTVKYLINGDGQIR